MKFLTAAIATFLLTGCWQINDQIVTRADSEQIREIPDGEYCQFTNKEYLDDLELMELTCNRIDWSPDNQYYISGESKYYAMRLDEGVVLVQEVPDTSENSEWIGVALFRVTKNAYTYISFTEKSEALAAQHGFSLTEKKDEFSRTSYISSGTREQYINFFRDIARGVELDGTAVSSIDPNPSFHMSLAGEVFKDGSPHPSTADIVTELTQFLNPAARMPSIRSTHTPAPASAPVSAPVSSSGVETLDEILTVLRTANVRARPSAQADKVGRLKAGAEIDVTGRTMVEGEQWYRIDLDGQEAYVIGYLISPSSAPQTTATPTYSPPATGSNVAATQTQPAKTGLQPGSTFKDCEHCPEMVVIPAGRFRMGDLNGGGDDDELPVHEVNIQKNFAVGKYEVTRDQYAGIARAFGLETVDGCFRSVYNASEQDAVVNWQTPGFEQTGRDPVTCVSWNEAKEYVGWLSNLTGHKYRLLSESEWEYAARAGTNTKYSYGNEARDMCNYGNGADISFANFKDDGKYNECNDGFRVNTAPIGSFRANGFGLHDMHGNVDEWVEDCWSSNYEGAPDDGSARTTGSCARRSYRGGSWESSPRELRSSYRSVGYPEVANHETGFRVARTLKNSN